MLARCKFELDSLIDEVLSVYPDKVWTSSKTTFLDFAIGGGQFVTAIENKLREYGHSDENIASRVYGYESNIMRVRFAVNKNKLVGNYSSLNPLTEDITDQFDVVISNPPYDSGNDSKGNKLWPKYILKAYELTKDNGYCSVVTPTGWASGGTNMPGGRGIIKDVFKKSQVESIYVNGITERFFSNIAIEIGYFLLHKVDVHKPTTLFLKDGETTVDFREVDFISPRLNKIDIGIAKKFFDKKFKTFDIQSFDRKVKKGTVDESPEPTDKLKHKHWVLGGTSAGNAYFTYLDFENTEFTYPKVLFNIGNRYWQPYYDLDGVNIAAQGFAVKLSGNETVESLSSVFEHPLFAYISFWYQLQMKGYMKTNIVYSYPYVDLTKTWKRDELYKHFGISKSESEHIEDILVKNKAMPA